MPVFHPRRRVETLSESEYDGLFHALRATLADMTAMGGRDTEKDLFGHIGGYQTILSKNTLGTPCPVCGAPVQKAAYLGGRNLLVSRMPAARRVMRTQ